MAAPRVPMSHLGYFVRFYSPTYLAATQPTADHALTAPLMAHHIGNNLAFLWDTLSQHAASVVFKSGQEIDFVGADTGGKTGVSGGYAYLTSVEFNSRLMPDGRPEPQRVLILGGRSSSDIWIRCTLRFASDPLMAPIPINRGSNRDGFTVGQASFTSSTATWKEVKKCSDASSINGALQFPAGTAPAWTQFSRSGGGVTMRDGWEPTQEVRCAVDFWGVFDGGTAGTGHLYGYMIRGEIGALLDAESAV